MIMNSRNDLKPLGTQRCMSPIRKKCSCLLLLSIVAFSFVNPATSSESSKNRFVKFKNYLKGRMDKKKRRKVTSEELTDNFNRTTGRNVKRQRKENPFVRLKQHLIRYAEEEANRKPPSLIGEIKSDLASVNDTLQLFKNEIDAMTDTVSHAERKEEVLEAQLENHKNLASALRLCESNVEEVQKVNSQRIQKWRDDYSELQTLLQRNFEESEVNLHKLRSQLDWETKKSLDEMAASHGQEITSWKAKMGVYREREIKLSILNALVSMKLDAITSKCQQATEEAVPRDFDYENESYPRTISIFDYIRNKIGLDMVEIIWRGSPKMERISAPFCFVYEMATLLKAKSAAILSLQSETFHKASRDLYAEYSPRIVLFYRKAVETFNRYSEQLALKYEKHLRTLMGRCKAQLHIFFDPYTEQMATKYKEHLQPFVISCIKRSEELYAIHIYPLLDQANQTSVLAYRFLATHARYVMVEIATQYESLIHPILLYVLRGVEQSCGFYLEDAGPSLSDSKEITTRLWAKIFLSFLALLLCMRFVAQFLVFVRNAITYQSKNLETTVLISDHPFDTLIHQEQTSDSSSSERNGLGGDNNVILNESAKVSGSNFGFSQDSLSVDDELQHRRGLICASSDDTSTTIAEIHDLKALLATEKRKSNLVSKLRESHNAAVSEYASRIRKLEAEKYQFRLEIYNKNSEIIQIKNAAEKKHESLLEEIASLREECIASEYMMNDEIQKYESEIERWKTENESKSLTDLEEKVSAVRAKVISEKNAEIAEMRSSFQKKLQGSKKKTKQLEQRIRKLEYAVSDTKRLFNARIAQLETEKVGLERAIAALKKYMKISKTGTDEEMAKLESWFSNEKDELARQQGMLFSELQGQLETLVAARTQNDERILELEAELERCKAESGQQNESLKDDEDGIHVSVTEPQNEIDTLKVQLDEQAASYEAEKEELRTDMERKVQSLISQFNETLLKEQDAAAEEVEKLQQRYQEATEELADLKARIKKLKDENEALLHGRSNLNDLR